MSFTVLVLAALAAQSTTTYSRDIAPVFRGKCEICHRPHDIAPFPLNTYAQVSAYGAEIHLALSANRMPPWKPAPSTHAFQGDFSLTSTERRLILDWIDSGLLQGDPADLPPPIETKDWPGGEPDLILQMPEPFAAPTRGDNYRCFVLPIPPGSGDYWRQIQVLPGNRRVVHHVLLFSAPLAAAQARDAEDPGQGYTCFGGPGLSGVSLVGAWVPGMRGAELPPGIAVEAKQGQALIMQVHYHGNSLSYTDQTQVGLTRASDPSPKLIRFLPIANMIFTLPPGKITTVEATQPAFISHFLAGRIYFVAPHMHLLGARATITLELPTGERQTLIEIPTWDFNWQGAYRYLEPISYPQGSRLHLSCTFDNTANNPNNPHNPLQAVSWGEGTDDEMCLGFVGVVPDQPPPAFLKWLAGSLWRFVPHYRRHASTATTVCFLACLVSLTWVRRSRRLNQNDRSGIFNECPNPRPTSLPNS